MYHFPKPGQANGSDSPTRPGMVLRALLLLGCASSAAGGIRTNYLGEDVFFHLEKNYLGDDLDFPDPKLKAQIT